MMKTGLRRQPGLRERKRRAAMHVIQEQALDLFDERGFGAVTIEEIATAAQVSASTVYRYFGTKEGLIVSDEFDTLSRDGLAAIFDFDDPVGTVRRVVADYEAAPDRAFDTGAKEAGSRTGTNTAQGPWRRVRYFFQEPSVRLAVYASLDEASNRIADSMLAKSDMTETRARVAAHAFVFGYFAALEQWYRDGSVQPIANYIDEGMWALREIWAQPR